jgi:hypothetical protein
MTFGFLALLVQMNFEMLGFVRELDQVSAQLIHTLFTWVSHGNKILKTYFSLPDGGKRFFGLGYDTPWFIALGLFRQLQPTPCCAVFVAVFLGLVVRASKSSLSSLSGELLFLLVLLQFTQFHLLLRCAYLHITPNTPYAIHHHFSKYAF